MPRAWWRSITASLFRPLPDTKLPSASRQTGRSLRSVTSWPSIWHITGIISLAGSLRPSSGMGAMFMLAYTAWGIMGMGVGLPSYGLPKRVNTLSTLKSFRSSNSTMSPL